MRILVTGGAGFIGSNFVHHVIGNTGHDVVTLDALTYAGDVTNLDGVMDHPRHDFIEGDIRDGDMVADILDNCTVIVNFAAETHVDRSITDANPFVSTNVQGTRTLLDNALEMGVEQFVQVSTDEVYGEIASGEFTESDRLNPRNPYAATKAGADFLALSYHTTHELPVVITRSSNNFGPRQHEEKFIPKLITSATAGEKTPIYGDGLNVREWTYVADNCRAILTVLNDGEAGEIYNTGSGVRRTNIDVARSVLDILDADDEFIEFVDDRPGHDQRYALDSSKIRSLGWEPEWSFEAGLGATVDWFT